MRLTPGLLILFISMPAGCTLIGGVDEFVDESAGGGTTTMTSTTTEATTTVGTGGGEPSCPGGCLDGDVCRAGDSLAACGHEGFACEACDDANPCTADACGAGGCENVPTSGVCPGGVCENGLCAPLAEDCANGIDDNSDGLIDCADPICSGVGYQCVPIPEAGWTGVAAFYRGALEVNCSGAFTDAAVSANAGLVAPDAACSACSCMASGSGCGAATITVTRADGGGCSAACDYDVGLPPAMCVTLETGGGCSGGSPTFSTDDAVAPAFAGTCSPSQQSPMVAPPTWTNNALVCSAPAGGGCSLDAVCSPPTPAGFTGACVYASGDVPCPAGYGAREVVFDGVGDDRSCSDCGCAPATCPGIIQLFSGNACNANNAVGQIPVPYSGACDEIASTKPRARFVPDAAAPKCDVIESTPIGAASPTGPTTVCCTE